MKNFLTLLVLIPSLAWGKTIDIVCFYAKLELIFVKKKVTNK